MKDLPKSETHQNSWSLCQQCGFTSIRQGFELMMMLSLAIPMTISREISSPNSWIDILSAVSRFLAITMNKSIISLLFFFFFFKYSTNNRLHRKFCVPWALNRPAFKSSVTNDNNCKQLCSMWIKNDLGVQWPQIPFCCLPMSPMHLNRCKGRFFSFNYLAKLLKKCVNQFFLLLRDSMTIFKIGIDSDIEHFSFHWLKKNCWYNPAIRYRNFRKGALLVAARFLGPVYSWWL